MCRCTQRERPTDFHSRLDLGGRHYIDVSELVAAIRLQHGR